MFLKTPVECKKRDRQKEAWAKTQRLFKALYLECKKRVFCLFWETKKSCVFLRFSLSLIQLDGNPESPGGPEVVALVPLPLKVWERKSEEVIS